MLARPLKLALVALTAAVIAACTMPAQTTTNSQGTATTPADTTNNSTTNNTSE